jgi:hypothetical protein
MATNPKAAFGLAKPPMSTVSALVLQEVGVAMLEGALKYGRHNYRGTPVTASIYYDGANRHLQAWWEGQDIDPASGLHHITKAITSLVVLRDAMIIGTAVDDRPPSVPDYEAFVQGLTNNCAELYKRYGSVNPKHYTREALDEKDATCG